MSCVWGSVDSEERGISGTHEEEVGTWERRE